MHHSALFNAHSFFNCYAPQYHSSEAITVVEIGSQNVNGTLRTVTPSHYEYIGLDFVAGNGVDIVLDDPYTLPIKSNSVDFVISSSCFEHSQLFWLTFLEMMRILKPGGLCYINAPSNGDFHRWPVDCWRFYPDSGNALVTWAKRNQLNIVLLESYISNQTSDIWNDFVAVFLKDESAIHSYPERILHEKTDFYNGIINTSSEIMNFRARSEDQLKIETLLTPK
jgi:SAM-dependent methyltransferase